MMAWRRQGNEALSEPIVCSLLAHICVNRPEWVNYDDVVDDDVGVGGVGDDLDGGDGCLTIYCNDTGRHCSVCLK